MKTSKIIETGQPAQELSELLDGMSYNKLFLLTDSNVERCVLPLLKDFTDRYRPEIIVFPAGEENKNLQTLAGVWERMSTCGGTRNSVLINVGGGVVTDLGGFAAASFKRGIRFINVPTSVLGAVDASVGGKTGIDFMGLKNEIGAFHIPEAVVVCEKFFETLSPEEFISGFAEIVKMTLLGSEALYREIVESDTLPSGEELRKLVTFSIREKERITTEDPQEKGLRRILNLGHTMGHAYESLALRRQTPITHGCGVAHGMYYALRLSARELGLPAEIGEEYKERILDRYYPALPFGEEAHGELKELMMHDKKNTKDGMVTFVLLEGIGRHVVKELSLG